MLGVGVKVFRSAKLRGSDSRVGLSGEGLLAYVSVQDLPRAAKDLELRLL